MFRILALDTSTEACSCALYLDGSVYEQFAVIPRQHANSMLPMIESLLEQHSLGFDALDALAWGRGPGSFTGLRIAAGIVQGLAFAAGLPVVSVSTLEALALQLQRERSLPEQASVLACIDARIDELYWACYKIRDGWPQLIGDEQLCAPEALPMWPVPDTAGLAAVGSGLVYRERFPAALRTSLGVSCPELLPRAADIARIAAVRFQAGAAHPPHEAQPLYLRDKVTHS